MLGKKDVTIATRSGWNLNAVSSGDGMKSIDQDSSALALTHTDQGLPRETAESCRFAILLKAIAKADHTISRLGVFDLRNMKQFQSEALQ